MVRKRVQFFSYIIVCHLCNCQGTGLPWGSGCKDELDLDSANFRLLCSIVGARRCKNTFVVSGKCGIGALLREGLLLV